MGASLVGSLPPSHSIPGEETTFPICGTLLLLPFPILFSHELSYATAVCGRKFLKLVPSSFLLAAGFPPPFLLGRGSGLT